jgi:polysaccharide export outer membrane protein
MFRILISWLVVMVTATVAAAQSEYLIRPGDTLSVSVLEDASVNGSGLVLPDGSINLPMAGVVIAGGRSVAQAGAAVSTALAPNFVTPPSVTVAVTGLAERAPARAAATARTIDVFALGEFNSPGKFAVAQGTTLLQFLAESGGMSRFAATKRIQLRRYNPATATENIYGFDYERVLSGGQGIGASRLIQGDVIVIPERGLFE